MACVIALIPDLLFGSRVQADLLAAGHQIELVGTVDDARERSPGSDVLIVDLTDERLDSAGLVEGLGAPSTAVGERAGGDDAQAGAAVLSQRPRTLGFYSHVDVDARRRAESAGFDLIVPRSRMAREGAALVTRLAERR
jgi:hypothetical protein